MELKEIKANKEAIIKAKKNSIKSWVVNDFKPLRIKGLTNKELPNDSDEVIFRQIVANSYYWMDSHDDVHVDGVFTKSIKERGKYIGHFHDHMMRLDCKVGDTESIEEKIMSWADLGISKAGNTTVLLAVSKIKKDYNKSIFEQYKEGQITQHSVGMQYIKMALAMNDESEVEEFKVWNQYIGQLGNSEKAIEKGYFWVIQEAKLFEYSAVVMGSNELTPTKEESNLEGEIKNRFGEVKNLDQLCNLIALESEAAQKALQEKQAATKKSIYSLLK